MTTTMTKSVGEMDAAERIALFLLALIGERVVHELRGEHGHVGGGTRCDSDGVVRHELGRDEDELGRSGLGNLNDLLLIGQGALNGECEILCLLILRDGCQLDGVLRDLLGAAAPGNDSANDDKDATNEGNDGSDEESLANDHHDVKHVRGASRGGGTVLIVLLKGALGLDAEHGLADILSYE